MVIVSCLIQVSVLVEANMHIQQNNFGSGGRHRGKRGGQKRKKQELSQRADDDRVVTGKEDVEHYQPKSKMLPKRTRKAMTRRVAWMARVSARE